MECDNEIVKNLDKGTYNFNSRTHVECDTPKAKIFHLLVYFNSRTHVECDTRLSVDKVRTAIFQLTHSRGVRLPDRFAGEWWYISTHALTWSATADSHCAGCFSGISTHALTWSATYAIVHWNEAVEFQLTHSRGVRRVFFNSVRDYANFNSRTHVECDYIFWRIRSKSTISTHALTWSATIWTILFGVASLISTHALTWSATQRNPHKNALHLFQLTHSRGVRPAFLTCKSGKQ